MAVNHHIARLLAAERVAELHREGRIARGRPRIGAGVRRSVPEPPPNQKPSTDATADVVLSDGILPQVVEDPSATAIDLLRNWRRATCVADLAHSRATDVLSRRNSVLGALATVFGAIVSAGAFTTLQVDRAPVGVRLGAAIVAAAAAALIGLQTYMNYGARAERHRRTSREYDRLLHKMDELLSDSPSTVRNERLDRIRREFAQVADAAPNVGPSAWRWADRAVASEEQRECANDASMARRRLLRS